MTIQSQLFTRRRILRALAAAPFLAACPATRARSGAGPRDASTPGGDEAAAPGTAVAVPRECRVTEDNIEGPFFLPGAPHRAVLVGPTDPGTRLVLAGQVLTTGCVPIDGARIEVWQADALGAYDVDGFRFRGQLVTAADGSWQVTTIVPGRYLNGTQYRPAHVHVKLEHPRFAPLTTQLYFEGDPFNDVDPFVRRSLILPLRSQGAGKVGRFDFVLPNA